MVGSGILGDYLINSNTSLGKFASNTLEDKPDGIPAEVASGSSPPSSPVRGIHALKGCALCVVATLRDIPDATAPD